MAYGTPRSTEEILPYYTDIRRGRVPTPEQLSDLTARYDAIGGISPLAARTEAQRDALQHALDTISPDKFHVQLGLKHAHPMIEESVNDLAQQGFTTIIALVLAPHYSSYSIGQYVGRATEAALPHGINVIGIDSWATEPAFIRFIANDMERNARICLHELVRSSLPTRCPSALSIAATHTHRNCMQLQPPLQNN